MIRLRLGLALLLASTSALAADPKPSIDARVDKVEKELRAVQRKVFPGGSPAFFEPEIAPPAAPPAGNPASAPLNDLTARLDALEKSVATLTGQLEQDEHRLTLLSEQAAKDRAEFGERLKKLETPPAPVAAAPAVAEPAPEEDEAPALPTPKPVKAVPAKAPATKPAPAKATPVKAAPAIADDGEDEQAAPAANDPAEAAYMAGYKLWTEKKYPQAQAALKSFVAKYPKHRRASYAQNLLGRAYLDAGQPGTAAQAFAANYQTNPRGERAPDSLYYLGQSLQKLDKPADACRVYGELDAAYGEKLSDTLKARVVAARKDAKCK